MRISTGTVEGTGSALSINCGFTPQKVQAINIDGDVLAEWTADMGAGTIYKVLGTGLGALAATGGITISAVTATFIGFTIGTDTDLNATAETIIWSAWPATD